MDISPGGEREKDVVDPQLAYPTVFKQNLRMFVAEVVEVELTNGGEGAGLGGA